MGWGKYGGYNIKLKVFVVWISPAGSARSRQSYARPPATQQNGQHDVSEIVPSESKKPGIPVPGRWKSWNIVTYDRIWTFNYYTITPQPPQTVCVGVFIVFRLSIHMPIRLSMCYVLVSELGVSNKHSLLAHLSTKCSWWAIVVSQCPSCILRCQQLL